MDTPRTIVIHAGVAHLAYGMALSDKKDFKSPLAFDDYDLWFGADFDYLLNELLDDLLDDIESDITSVDSTNLSEAASEQASAQSSANRAALQRAGLLASDETSTMTGNSLSRVSSVSSEHTHEGSVTDPSGDSADPSSNTTDDMNDTPTDSHSHGHHGGYHNSESDYSGRSHTDDDDSGLSDSEGTS